MCPPHSVVKRASKLKDLQPALDNPSFRPDTRASPIVVPAVAFLLSLFLMPETRKNRIWGPEEARVQV